MKIRRQFKGRTYSKGGVLPKMEIGGTECGPNMVKDQFGKCVPVGGGTVLQEGNTGVPNFTSGVPNLPKPVTATNRLQAAIQNANDPIQGVTPPYIDPTKTGVDNTGTIELTQNEAENGLLPGETNGKRPKVFAMGDTSVKGVDNAGLQAYNQTLQSSADAAGLDIQRNIDAKRREEEVAKQEALKTKPKDTLFNPYGGIDIPTAAYIAGQEWGKGGNKTMAVGASLKFLAGSARNFMSGMGNANVNAQGVESYNKKQREGMIGNYTYMEDGGYAKGDIDALLEGIDFPAMEDGGEVDIDLLTGNYAKGTNNGDENVELEDGEYLKEPDGNVKEVEGKTHEQSDEDGTGEKMKLEPGTEVISDNLTFNKDQAKQISEEFGIKVGVKDTFAKSIEKYNKKIGLYDLIEEEEEILEELKKQKEKINEKGADEATSNINLEFLSSKLKDIGDEKVALEEKAKQAFDVIFKMQEDSKPAKEKEEEKSEYALGGVVYSKDQILEIANKFNIDKAKALEIVSGMEKAENGTTVTDPKKGTKVSEELAKSKVASGEWDYLGGGRYIKRGEPGTEFVTVESLGRLDSYKKAWDEEGRVDKNKYPTYEAFAQAAEKYWESNSRNRTTTGKTPGTPDKLFFTEVNALDFKPMGINPHTPKFPEFNIDPNYVPYDQRPKTQDPNNVTDGEFTPTGDENDKKGKANIMFLPDNLPMTPQGLQMPLKVQRRYGRADLQAVSPEGSLAELNRSVDAAMEQIQNLPSGQKEAAMVKLESNKQAQADKIIESYNTQQNQLDQTEQMFNIRQGDREIDAGAIDALDYERRTFGAMANTEDDYRRFFNTVQERNIQNFNTVNSANLLNQAYDNFDFGNNGVEFTGGAGPSAKEAMDAWKWKQAFAAGQSTPTTTTKKKTTATAKRGGRIKR